MSDIPNEIEIQAWLNQIFVEDQYLSVKTLEKAGKGAGFLGEVFFVLATATNAENEIIKTYDLVVKCSQRCKILREKTPTKNVFFNEIFFYNVVYPSFVSFQKMRKVEHPFINIPKYYGAHTEENIEVLVLQNLRSDGYMMWDQKKTLTRKHIDKIVESYAKFHAISVAMKHQESVRFHKLANNLFNPYEELASQQFVQPFIKTTQNVYNLIKDKVNQETASKWKKIIEEVPLFFEQRALNCLDGINVILHGDSWNNNFLHQYEASILKHFHQFLFKFLE